MVRIIEVKVTCITNIALHPLQQTVFPTCNDDGRLHYECWKRRAPTPLLVDIFRYPEVCVRFVPYLVRIE